MPRIKEYTPRVEAQGPVQTRRAEGEDFGGGRGLQQLGGAVFETGQLISRRAEQSEVSDLHVKMAKANEDFSTRLDQLSQSGQLDQKKYMEEYDTYMSSIEEGISTRAGQEYYRQVRAQQQAHLSINAYHEQASLAGIKAKENHMQASGFLSASLMREPRLLPEAIAQNDLAIDSMVKNGGLPAPVGEQLKARDKREFAVSAIRGEIKLNPIAATKSLDEGKYDFLLDGDAKKQLYGEARMQINANEAEIERRRSNEEKALKQKQLAQENEMFQKLHSPEGLSTQDVLASNLDRPAKEHMINLIRQESRVQSKTDPAFKIATFERIHLPDGDPRKIVTEGQINALVGKGLSVADAIQLRSEISGNRTAQGRADSEARKSFVSIAKNQQTKSNPAIGIKDPEGDLIHAQFLSEVQEAEAKADQNGVPKSELYDPKSKNYMGYLIDKYKRSRQDIIKSITRSIRGNTNAPAPSPSPSVVPAEPRQPGESAEAYLKRTGK